MGLPGVDFLVFLGQVNIQQWAHPHDLEENGVEAPVMLLQCSCCLHALFTGLIPSILVIEDQV